MPNLFVTDHSTLEYYATPLSEWKQPYDFVLFLLPKQTQV
jgi:hypothetical protein